VGRVALSDHPTAGPSFDVEAVMPSYDGLGMGTLAFNTPRTMGA